MDTASRRKERRSSNLISTREELGRNYSIQLGMQGDIRNSLRRMIDGVETAEPRPEWINRVQELVRTWKESVSDYGKLGDRADAPGTPLQRADRSSAIRCNSGL